MKNQHKPIRISLLILLSFIIFFGSASAIVNRPEKTDSLKLNENNDELIYSVVEQMPEFPSGEKELMKCIVSNIKYPVKSFENKEQGKVFVRFVVNKKGKVEKAEVIRSVSFNLDKEALRVVSKIPDFIPGMQNGKNVNVYYTLPISFKLGLK